MCTCTGRCVYTHTGQRRPRGSPDILSLAGGPTERSRPRSWQEGPPCFRVGLAPSCLPSALQLAEIHGVPRGLYDGPVHEVIMPAKPGGSAQARPSCPGKSSIPTVRNLHQSGFSLSGELSLGHGRLGTPLQHPEGQEAPLETVGLSCQGPAGAQVGSSEAAGPPAPRLATPARRGSCSVCRGWRALPLAL